MVKLTVSGSTDDTEQSVVRIDSNHMLTINCTWHKINSSFLHLICTYRGDNLTPMATISVDFYLSIEMIAWRVNVQCILRIFVQ